MARGVAIALGISVLAGGILAFQGCSRTDRPKGSLGTFTMGERVTVGPLVYTVQEAEWRDQLGDGPGARTPQYRFLVIRLSVTNSGIRPAEIPHMSLIGADGQAHAELTEAKALPDWLGFLRSVAPAATEHGRVLFDVPSGSYRLRLTTVAEGDEELFALVEIPFQVPPAPPLVPQTQVP